jgi:hypothetical protein
MLAGLSVSASRFCRRSPLTSYEHRPAADLHNAPSGAGERDRGASGMSRMHGAPPSPASASIGAPCRFSTRREEWVYCAVRKRTQPRGYVTVHALRNASTSPANSAWCWNRNPCAESG